MTSPLSLLKKRLLLLLCEENQGAQGEEGYEEVHGSPACSALHLHSPTESATVMAEPRAWVSPHLLAPVPLTIHLQPHWCRQLCRSWTGTSWMYWGDCASQSNLQPAEAGHWLQCAGPEHSKALRRSQAGPGCPKRWPAIRKGLSSPMLPVLPSVPRLTPQLVTGQKSWGPCFLHTSLVEERQRQLFR